jgi:hypothetical protein
LNNLEVVLKAVLTDKRQIAELIKTSPGALWMDPILRIKLEHKLGRNYGLFTANVAAAYDLLNQLSNKLVLTWLVALRLVLEGVSRNIKETVIDASQDLLGNDKVQKLESNVEKSVSPRSSMTCLKELCPT